MAIKHSYNITINWTGNTGFGTKDYSAYERSHIISIENKVDLFASSDKSFLGDGSKHNPEELFISSISSCHMLWYLHLCAINGIVVIKYRDDVSGTMVETAENGGHFTEVVLRPIVVITDATRISRANELHKEANKMCFIANSCNFPISYIPQCSALSD